MNTRSWLVLAVICSAGCTQSKAPPPLLSIDEIGTDKAVLWTETRAGGAMQLEFESVQGSLAREWIIPAAGTHAMKIDSLTPSTTWTLKWAYGDHNGSLEFATVPLHDDVRIAFGAELGGQNVCRDAHHGYEIFATLANTSPDLFVGLGDLVYTDGRCEETGLYGNRQVAGEFGTAIEDIAAHWAYQYEDPALRSFRAQLPWYVTWDDHEILNDFHPSEEGTARLIAAHQGLAAYHPGHDERGFRNVPLHRHAELLLLDTRSYRDPNDAPDTGSDPKTMLGPVQRNWLSTRLRQSNATWKIIATSVPLAIPTGTAAPGIRDGWANGDTDTGYERELLGILEEAASAGVSNLVFISADVHFATGFRYTPFGNHFEMHEFVVGPLNAGVFPSQQLDSTLQPQRLFFYAPPGASDIASFEDAQRWFNFGLLDINTAGVLTFQLINGLGETVYQHTLRPNTTATDQPEESAVAALVPP